MGAARMKQGELTVQHGDVVVLKTGSESVEVQLKMEGFGFGECKRCASTSSSDSFPSRDSRTGRGGVRLGQV
jgi:hypothetical protein